MAYIANTDADVRAMLAAIGIDSLDALFDMVPPEFRLDRALEVPPALTEFGLTSEISSLIATNEGADRRPCFLGGGSYDHFVPAVVDQLAARGEYYTAYTPYQAEASQGTLQATFEYQTLIAELTGMDVSNASLYDGGSAAAEAMLMAMTITRRHGRVVVAGTVHPEYREILRTYLANLEPELVTVPTKGGKVEPADVAAAVTDDTSAVIVQHPNFFGGLEDVEALVEAAHAKGALAIVSVDPISLGLLKRPGSYGADIVIAEGQGLGNHLNYGGPYLGILACREEYVRKMPGRVVGQTTDRHGKRCFTLTLQTREQHIRREKATSNICTNQGLLALRASIYLAVVGPLGLRQAAELSTHKAHYAAERLAGVPGLSLAFKAPYFKEFVVRSKKDPSRVLAEVGQLGYHGGIALGRWFPELSDGILVAVTEKRTKAEIDGLAEAYTKACAGR
ncbi:MAG TPA: aminomethyl-transferring glycine dehydrogenase subunit GcvPA [Isosphaeraceae bacterium]|jgi:glycine dehydrogenase subunit 1